MKEWLVFATHHAVTVIDAMALVIVFMGTVEAFVLGLQDHACRTAPGTSGERCGCAMAAGSSPGLTFQLAADIIETSIAPTWDDIGRLAAIAVIRTGLNYFLERDLTEARQRQRESEARGHAMSA